MPRFAHQTERRAEARPTHPLRVAHASHAVDFYRHNNPRRTLLIFTQVFVPDPASVGQHVADVAVEMARRGHPVRVYTSARGYEDPSVRYPPREDLHGVRVRRLPLS